MKVPVLLMARELHLGGSERQMTEIAKALDPQMFETHVGAFRVQGMRADELRAAQVPVVQFPVYSYKSPSALYGMASIVHYVRCNNIRIVHSWDYPTAVSVMPAIRLFTKAAALASIRGHRELIPAGYRFATRISDRFSHGIVANCEYLQEQLLEDRVPKQKIRLCYNGVDLSRFRRTEIQKPAVLRRASLIIGTVCALRKEKDLPTLIEAFSKVRHTCPGAMLAIVGSGPELRAWQEHAKRCGVSDACHFEPATPDISAWLSAMDIFVLPSRTEAFSNALMEAMASRCCVIASRVGGNPELIHDGETGLLFEAGNATDLAKQLRSVMDQPERLRALAESAERYIQAFSIADAARKMGQIYSGFLGSERG